MLISNEDKELLSKLDKFKNICTPNDKDKFDIIIRMFYRNLEKQLDLDNLTAFRNAMAHLQMLLYTVKSQLDNLTGQKNVSKVNCLLTLI